MGILSWALAPRERFTVTTANIKCNPVMPLPRVRSDIKEIRVKNGGIIGFQEICLEYRDSLVEAVGQGWDVYAPNECAIAWDATRWVLRDKGERKISDGVARVTPDRYVTWVVLKNKRTRKLVTFVNTHWVSGAFNKHKTHTALRRSIWYQDQQGTLEVVNKLKKSSDYLVVVGDFNKGRSKVLRRSMSYDFIRGVCYIMHVPSRRMRVVRRWATNTTTLFTDHAALSVRYRIR